MTKEIKREKYFNEFSKWVNRHPLLDSLHCKLAVTDADYIFHKYMTSEDRLGSRKIHYALFLETKTNGAKLPQSQRDTLGILDQLLRTKSAKDQRSDNGHFLAGHSQNFRIVRSSFMGRNAIIYCFGVFVLTMSGLSPSDSAWMTWEPHCYLNGAATKAITVDELVGILSFKIYPDTFKKLEHRRRKKGNPQPHLDFGTSEN